MSRQRLGQLGKGRMPEADRGWWPIREVIAWRMDGSGTREDLEKMSLKDRKLYWEALLKKAQTENRELENGIKRGDISKNRW